MWDPALRISSKNLRCLWLTECGSTFKNRCSSVPFALGHFLQLPQSSRNSCNISRAKMDIPRHTLFAWALVWSGALTSLRRISWHDCSQIQRELICPELPQRQGCHQRETQAMKQDAASTVQSSTPTKSTPLPPQAPLLSLQ